MKINNILENMTPSSSTANQGGGQAPVMGRSDKFLETTSGASSSAVISPGGETTSKIQRRGKEGSNLLRGIKTSKKFVNSPMAESTVSEADISEEHLGAKERRKELFNKSKDRQLGNRPDSKDILPKDMEGEGDTLKNSLHTIIRVATHLDKALSVHDEFPEWISEKIGATKSMMVNIMNYVISNQEMQDDGEEINELSSEKLGQYKKAAGAQASELDKAAWAGAPDAKSKINKANKRFDGIVKATKKQFANDIKKHYDGKTQGVAEATGDKPFDNMMKTIKKGTKKQATADRREQKAKNKEQAAAAFGNMFGGSNPADKLKIKEQGAGAGLERNLLDRLGNRVGATPGSDINQVTDAYQQKIIDRMGKRFGLPPGSSMEQVQAAQQAYLNKNDPQAAAQYKQNMANIDAGGTRAANKPVQLMKKPGMAENAMTPLSGPTLKQWMGKVKIYYPEVKFVQAKMPGSPVLARFQNTEVGRFDQAKGISKITPPPSGSIPSFKGVAEGSGESYIIVRTDAEGKKDVFAGNFDTYEQAQKELDACLAHPLHTKYKQKFEIKRKGGEQGVAEESKGLWANIHAKQKRIKSGSGEHMRKPGSKGAPTAKSFKDSATKSVKETGAPAPTRMNPPREYNRRRGD